MDGNANGEEGGRAERREGGEDNDKWVDEDWGDEKSVRKQMGEKKEPYLIKTMRVARKMEGAWKVGEGRSITRRRSNEET